MLHYDSSVNPPAWNPVTTNVDTVANVICGASASLSPFVLAESDPTDTRLDLPKAYRLLANVPNPFNPITTIRYELPHADHVRLEILDVSGRLVRTLVNGPVEAGNHAIEWRGEDARGRRVASGVYFYRLDSGSYVATRRMVLLK